MTIRFTHSQDGIPRATICVKLRLTQEEIDTIKELARAQGESWRSWLTGEAENGLYTAMLSEDGSYEQRYGKGEG